MFLSAVTQGCFRMGSCWQPLGLPLCPVLPALVQPLLTGPTARLLTLQATCTPRMRAEPPPRVLAAAQNQTLSKGAGSQQLTTKYIVCFLCQSFWLLFTGLSSAFIFSTK